MREGASTHAAAERFGIAIATAVRWRSPDRAGWSDPLPMGGDRRLGRIEAEAKFLQSLMDDKDDITLHEMQSRLANEGAPCRHRHALALLRPARADVDKKSAHASEQERPDLLKRRQAWFDDQLDLDPAKLLFIDETSLSTKIARRYGRASRGERCRSGVPHGHWKTTTFTAALRLTSMTAPMVLDGPMNGLAFRAYVDQVLMRTLSPGDIVVMDNLLAHKAEGVRPTI